MIRLIVDSTFGFDKEFIEENKIGVVDLKLIIDDEVIGEGFFDSWDEKYDKMANAKKFPTTSQPSPQDYIDIVEQFKKEDANCEVIIMSLASRLSGTFNSASLAARNFEDGSVVAIDSKQATFASQIVAREVLRMINENKTVAEIKEEVEKIILNTDLYFIPHNMDSLRAGGRINTIAATLVSILKIKPIFRFYNNEINIAKKSLGLNRAILDVVSLVPKNVTKLVVGFIRDKVNIDKFIETIKSKFANIKIEQAAVDPVFGVHVGIGAIGLAFMNN